MSSKGGSDEEDHRSKDSPPEIPQGSSETENCETTTTTTARHESDHREAVLADAPNITPSSQVMQQPVEVIETIDDSMVVAVRGLARGHVQESLLETLSSLVTHEVKDVRTEGDTIMLVLNIPDNNANRTIQDLEQELQVALNLSSRRREDHGGGGGGGHEAPANASANGCLKDPSSSVPTIATLPASTDNNSSLPEALKQHLPTMGDTKHDETGSGAALEYTAAPSPRNSGASRPGNNRGNSLPGAFYIGVENPRSRMEWDSTRSMTSGVENEETAAVPELDVEDSDRHSATVRAFKVDEVAHEENVRQRILDEAVEADVVDHEAALKRRHRRVCVFSIVMIAVCAITIGVAVIQSQKKPTVVLATEVPTMSPSGQPTQIPRPTLERVSSRGTLLCGAGNNVAGLHDFKEETNSIEGLTVDLCRAIATVVLGNASRMEIVPLATIDRFEALLNGKVDLLARTETHTMAREVVEPTTGASFSFSSPFLYSGLVFKGVPAFVECAETVDSYFGICRQLRICVEKATSLEAIVERLFPPSYVLKTESLISAFVNGTCNAVATEPVTIQEGLFRAAGYGGDFISGTLLFSNEPLALVTRRDDPQWSDIVDAVLNALWIAEAQGATQTSAASFLLSSTSAGSTQSAFADAIAAVGNYGEIFSRHLDGIIPRNGLNMLNLQGSTGLLYPLPFGSLEQSGPEFVQDGVLQAILERGRLRCGLPANWNELDVSFCRVVSTAIFAANSTERHVTFVTLSQDEKLHALATGEIDVFAGEISGLLGNDVLNATWFSGFFFSSPYFYGSPADLSNTSSRCLVTRQDDNQWSTFVDWCLIATIFAEEQAIGRNISVQMPVVNLFGQRFVHMFRDIIASNGNYGTIYSQALGEAIPRAGRNLLNTNPHGPQQYPFTLFP